MGGGFGAKHQHKVNECYPQGTGETGAASGKISSLTFYINAKPAKLLKVSAYLEKKVVKDLARESPQYNGVTLEIVEGIMRDCSEYFVTFAPTVLRIILLYSDAMLANELVNRVHKLFVECCRMTKGILPSIREVGFFELLSQVLERLLQRPISGQLNPDKVARDVMAAVVMEDFKAPLGERRINAIVSTIVREFKSQESSTLTFEEISQLRSVGALELNSTQMNMSAFVALVEGSNSTTVPMIMDSIFREFDKDGWERHRLCSLVHSILVHAVPAQYLCVVLSEIFRKLEASEDLVTTVLAETIAELLRANRSPLGYSALELANNLLKLLRKQRNNLNSNEGVNLRASFANFRVPPARTVFSICNAFVSLLRNANFALQKYEVIEHLISKAFFPGMRIAGEDVVSLRPIPRAPDHHSIGTVTLDSTEEGHFRAVVWGILFALAEEGTPPSVLRLAFVDLHIRLFELLFRMMSTGDDEFCLNTLVLWQRLIHHGLSIIPNRRTLVESPGSPSTIVLGRPSYYILTKSRVILAEAIFPHSNVASFVSIVHVSATLALLQILVLESDSTQLAQYLIFVLWVCDCAMHIPRFTFEDKSCVALFTNYIIRDIGSILPKPDLGNLAKEYISKLNDAGLSMIEMKDILDMSQTGPIISGAKEFNPIEMVPSVLEAKEAFIASSGDPKIENILKGIERYQIEEDERSLMSLVPSVDRPPPSIRLQVPSEKSSTGTFSRLSKLGSTGLSTATAPAFYRSEASSSGHPARTLTISSSSLAQSDIISAPVDVLDGQFDELSVRMRENKQKEHSRSMLFFGRE